MITLTLLHPFQPIPVQSWPFKDKSVIRIGRSADNEVILYSAVVSRYHVELRHNGSDWEVFSLGANGTYLKGKRFTQVSANDGMIIRLASSGPKIQIHIEQETPHTKLKSVLERQAASRKVLLDQSKDTFVNYQE